MADEKKKSEEKKSEEDNATALKKALVNSKAQETRPGCLFLPCATWLSEHEPLPIPPSPPPQDRL
eukprot:7104727-Alexandrium_andersonii.AAC.1